MKFQQHLDDITIHQNSQIYKCVIVIILCQFKSDMVEVSILVAVTAISKRALHNKYQ